ncbi:MAG TPA: NAD(P)H-binding protein [Kofleriaceae bacterium]|nr:NAD(P)H-binding protein [Kofleriaceae bacterium]
MDFLVFGASGRTGGAFVRQAVAANHAVGAFVRDASSLPAGVDAHVGDVLDAAAVSAAIRGTPTIIIALGGVDALTRGAANVIDAATSAGVRRVLGVVGAGVLQADAARQRHEMPDYPPRFRPIGAAHAAVLTALRASPLEWTLACTPNIVDGPATGTFAERADYLPDGTGSISTGDIAAFLLREAIASRYPRSRVGLNGSPRA